MSAVSVWAPRAVTGAGGGELERVRVRLSEGQIARVETGVEPRDDDTVFTGGTLVPGLVDLQVNGGGGASYDAEDAETRRRATRWHTERGTTSLLATLVSAPLAALESALERLAADAETEPAIAGIHLEGPFLAAAKAGAHAARHLLDPTPERVERLIARGAGALRLVTLAPERPGALGAIAAFCAAGARVAAGHTEADVAQLQRAADAGLDLFTHVGNASDWPGRRFDPDLGYRRSVPGAVGAFLAEPRLRGTLILDGHHLDCDLARALIEIRGAANMALVSDAAPAAGEPPGSYRLGDVETTLHAGGYATAGEGLAGSVVALADCVRTAVQRARLDLATAIQLASANPAQWLGLGKKGALAQGCDADLLVLDGELRVAAVWLGGERVV